MTDEFTREDVEHIDTLVAMAREEEGVVGLPGANHVRNKVARRVGIATRPVGEITWATIRETDYGGSEPAPREQGPGRVDYT